MKNILNKAGKTLATIVLASTIGLSGCTNSTQKIEVDNYSCMQSKSKIFVSNPETNIIIEDGNKKVTRRTVDSIKYTELTYKNMSLEEATRELAVCEANLKKEYNK